MAGWSTRRRFNCSRGSELSRGFSAANWRRGILLAVLAFGQFTAVSPGSAQSAPAKEADSAGLYRKGMKLLREKHYPDALEQFRKLESADPSLPQGYEGEGTALALSGKLNEAVPALQKAITIDPSYWVARRSLGIIDWQLDRKEDAAKELVPLVKLFPDDTAVNAILGEYNFERGKYGSAVEFFSKARPQVVADFHLSLEASEALIKSGHSELASQELDGLSATPDLNARQRFQIAWLLLDAKAYSKAIPMFESLPPGFPDALGKGYGVALAYYGEGRYADCVKQLTAPEEHTTGSPQLFSLLGAAEEAQGQSAAAQRAFQTSASQFPQRAETYLDSAAAAMQYEDYDAAAKILALGIQQLPGDYRLFLVRGSFYGLQHNLEKAQADYEKAATLAPGNARTFVALGICLMEQNKNAAAAEILRQALHQGLADVWLYYYLVDVLFQQGFSVSSPTYQEAWSAVDASITLRDDFAYSYLQKGKLLWIGNHREEALASFEQARKLAPDSTMIAHELAQAYIAAGRTAGSGKGARPDFNAERTG